jgi:hypothetical protein
VRLGCLDPSLEERLVKAIGKSVDDEADITDRQSWQVLYADFGPSTYQILLGGIPSALP